MKKFLAILMTVLMLLCSVGAMADTVDWDDDLAALALSIDPDAHFHPVSNLGVMMWIPTNFKELQLTQEDLDNGYIAYLITDDETAAVAITYAEFDGTLGDMAEQAEAMGMKDVSKDYINGIPAVTFVSEENDSFVVVYSTTGGYLLMFTFAPISDETFNVVGTLMAASIQAVVE